MIETEIWTDKIRGLALDFDRLRNLAAFGFWNEFHHDVRLVDNFCLKKVLIGIEFVRMKLNVSSK